MSEHQPRTVRRRIGAVLQAAADRANRPAEQNVKPQPSLEERMAHLEALVEGLQDGVHHQAQRLEKRVAEVERKTEAEELAKALSADARRRGL